MIFEQNDVLQGLFFLAQKQDPFCGIKTPH